MSNQPPDALIITQSDIRRVMGHADFLEAVELGFRAEAMGKASSPMPMEILVSRGAFHAKGASISLRRDYVAVKVNGNFPDNPAKFGLPTIQGAILLADGGNGALLAIIDSIEVTIRRTAAASALAARLLAMPDSSALLVCGCGEQGRAHVEAIRDVLPIARAMLWDRNPWAAVALAAELDGTAVEDLGSAAQSADVIVTCTTSHQPFLSAAMIRPGTFVAAVGADKPDKSEIVPDVMGAATVVTDVTAQCAEMGDLRHALQAGIMTRADVHAQLGEVLTGAKSGRRSIEEIIIFDSTGTGLQDVAAAAAIFERSSGDASVQSVGLSAP